MNHGRAEGGGSGKARPDNKMGSELRATTSGYRRAMQKVMSAKRRRRDRGRN